VHQSLIVEAAGRDRGFRRKSGRPLGRLTRLKPTGIRRDKGKQARTQKVERVGSSVTRKRENPANVQEWVRRRKVWTSYVGQPMPEKKTTAARCRGRSSALASGQKPG